MATETFTPGPWQYEDCIDPRIAITARGFGEVIVVGGLYASKTGRANARLIAAAPDLLASLTDAAIRCAGRRGERFREHRCVDCSRWLDVIAKAVGP